MASEERKPNWECGNSFRRNHLPSEFQEKFPKGQEHANCTKKIEKSICVPLWIVREEWLEIIAFNCCRLKEKWEFLERNSGGKCASPARKKKLLKKEHTKNVHFFGENVHFGGGKCAKMSKVWGKNAQSSKTKFKCGFLRFYVCRCPFFIKLENKELRGRPQFYHTAGWVDGPIISPPIDRRLMLEVFQKIVGKCGKLMCAVLEETCKKFSPQWFFLFAALVYVWTVIHIFPTKNAIF